MNRFSWIDILSERTPAADGTVDVDLGLRPKAGIALRISALNATDMASYANLLALITEVRIELHGSAFIQVSGANLAAINAFLLGRSMIQENVLDTDNATRSLVLYIPFGIGLYDPMRGLWETQPDEAHMEIDVDIATSEADGLIIEAAALEIPDAVFSQCLRYTTLGHTPSATGDSDIDLPRVHPVIAYLLWGTTVHTGTAWTTTVDKITLLEDRNPEKFMGTHWELFHGLADFWLNNFDAWSGKFHTENTGASYAQNADTALEEADDTPYANYVWLPMCPDGNFDDPYDPSQFSDLKLRISAGDTNAMQIIPIELMTPRRL